MVLLNIISEETLKLGSDDVKQAFLKAQGYVKDSHLVPYDKRKVKCRDGDGK